MAIRLNDNYLNGFILKQEYTAIQPQVTAAHKMLTEKSGLGNDFLGWTTLPDDYDKQEYIWSVSLPESYVELVECIDKNFDDFTF